MCNFKKVLAMVLAMVMMLGVATVAFAGGEEDSSTFVYSPTKGDTTTYNTKGDYDIYTESHKNGNTIAFKTTDKYGNSLPTVSDVSAKTAGTVMNIAGMVIGPKHSTTEFEVVERTYVYPDGTVETYPQRVGKVIGVETKEIEKIGTGDYGIAANEKGANVVALNVKSKAPTVTVASRALTDSKIANVVIDADNVLIEKNATKGTKAKTVAFAFPKATKANQLTIKKGAFNGAKKVRIVVSPKMTTKELKKLKKKLKKNLGATAYKKIKIVRGQA